MTSSIISENVEVDKVTLIVWKITLVDLTAVMRERERAAVKADQPSLSHPPLCAIVHSLRPKHR